MTFSGSIFFTSFKSVTSYLIFLIKAIYNLAAQKLRRKKEEGRRMSLKIFFPKQKAPLFLGALFVYQKLKLSH